MATTISYEVLSLRRGKWEVESVTENKSEAISRANETLGSGHFNAVKVIGEKFNDETGETSSFTVLNKENRRSSKDANYSGTEKRKKSERRKKSDRRSKNRRKKKNSGGFVNFLVKMCLAIWAISATAAFLICQLT